MTRGGPAGMTERLVSCCLLPPDKSLTSRRGVRRSALALAHRHAVPCQPRFTIIPEPARSSSPESAQMAQPDLPQPVQWWNTLAQRLNVKEKVERFFHHASAPPNVLDRSPRSPTRLGIRPRDLGLLNKYSPVHCGLFAASRHNLAFTSRHYALYSQQLTLQHSTKLLFCSFF